MVNSQVTKEIEEALKIDRQTEKIPSPIPVVEVGIKLVKQGVVKQNTCLNATTATIYAVPTGEQFFIKSVTLSFTKDATATSTYSRVNASINGVTTTIAQIPHLTLTVGFGTAIYNFPNPLRVDPGTNITITHSTNVANISSNAVISGFIDEVT